MSNQLKTLCFAVTGSALVLLGLSACGGDRPGAGAGSSQREVPAVARIEGEVFYRERIMLRPGAELEVQLEDISRADAMATVVATTTIPLDGGPPYPFAVEYKPAEIDPRMRYAMRARITWGEELLFTNTEYIDPFSDSPVRILVQSVERPAGRGNTGREEGDSATEVWILELLGGEAAPPGSGGNPAVLELDRSQQTVSGFSGCNRYTGGFTSEGSSSHGTPLRFGPLASTRRACADGDQLEQAYLKALGDVDSYRIEGERLLLLSGSEIVATFKAG